MESITRELKTTHVENKAVAAYLGLAIGSSLGLTATLTPSANNKSSFYRYESQTREAILKWKLGPIADSTKLSLSLGDSILIRGCVDAHAVAQSFSNWILKNPYGLYKYIKRGVIHYRYSGIPKLAENLSDTDSAACIRTLPVALATYGLGNVLDIAKISRQQTHITHNHPNSDAATECVIQIIHAGLSGKDRESIRGGPIELLLESYPEFNYSNLPKNIPSDDIVDTIQTVFRSFFTTNSFEDCIADAISRGGPADKIGAIAGMIAGSYYGPHEIPYPWISQLDSELIRACEEQARLLLQTRFNEASLTG